MKQQPAEKSTLPTGRNGRRRRNDVTLALVWTGFPQLCENAYVYTLHWKMRTFLLFWRELAYDYLSISMTTTSYALITETDKSMHIYGAPHLTTGRKMPGYFK